jgi:polar amino acid transport system substrate-binding protein
MRKPFLDILILALVAAAGWAVWAGQQRPPDTYLEGILNAGVLRVGIDPTYPPFDTIESGRISGYDAELAQAIAGDLGVQVEFVPLALDTLYDALAAEKVDMLVSALPFVYEREAEVRYSVPYYQSGQVLLVRAGDASIASVLDLAAREVGVELGSNADTEARRLVRTSLPTMQLRSDYRSPDEALDAVAAGELDATITDNASAQAYLSAHAGRLRVLAPPLTDEPYVVAMPAKATALSARVDATIERLRASGELAEIMGLATR